MICSKSTNLCERKYPIVEEPEEPPAQEPVKEEEMEIPVETFGSMPGEE